MCIQVVQHGIDLAEYDILKFVYVALEAEDQDMVNQVVPAAMQRKL